MAEHRINMTANFSQYDTAIKNAINNMRQFGNVANAAGQSGNAGAMKFVKSLQNIDSQATTTRQRLAAMNTLLKEMEMQYNRLGTAARNGAFGRELQVAIDQARSRVAAYNRELQGVGMASGGTSAFGAIFGGNLAARAAMDAIRLLGRTIKDAVRINAEFEYSNATLAAVLGVAKDEMLDLTEQAKKLGSASLYSANEITNLQIELARLGFSKREIKDSTDAIAKLALATGVDLSKAATLTGSTLRAFGYDTKEAARVASVLGVSTTKSALNMEKLSTALGYASVVSRQAGLDIEDTVAILGKLVDNGLQATTAGVGIRNIFMDLSDKSSKLSKAIKQVTGRDNISGLDEFITALKEMRDAGMSMEDIASIIQRRVTPAFLNMLVNTEGITELRNDLKGCESELDNMASKMEDTLTGSSKKLKNAWEGLMLSFAEGNGILQETVVKITNLVNAIKRYNSITSNNTANQLSYYKKGIDKNEVSKYTKKYQGLTQEEVIEKEADRIELIQKNYDRFMPYLVELNKLEKNANAFNALPGTESSKLYKEIMEELDTSFGIKSRKELIDYLSELSDKIDTSNAIIENFAVNKKVSISGNEGLGLAETLKGTSKSKDQTPQERAQEHVNKALHKFDVTMEKIGMELDAGLITGEQYLRKKISAEEQVYTAYSDAYEIFADPEYKTKMKEWMYKVANLSAKTADLANALDEMRQTAKDRERLMKEQRKTDLKTYNELYRVAEKARSKFPDSELTAGYFGLTEFRDRMNADINLNITDEEWMRFVEEFNKKLKELGLDQIELDVASGNVTELKGQPNSVLFGSTEAYGGSIVDLAGTVVSTIQTISNNLETLGVNINENFKKGLEKTSAVISIISAIGGLLSTINAVIIAIALSKIIPFFHDGGIVHAANGYFVPGAKNGGRDTVPSILAPGELVLNAAQQSNLAAQLQGVGLQQHIYVEGRVSGQNILLASNNYNRARGGSRGAYTSIK